MSKSTALAVSLLILLLIDLYSSQYTYWSLLVIMANIATYPVALRWQRSCTPLLILNVSLTMSSTYMVTGTPAYMVAIMLVLVVLVYMILTRLLALSVLALSVVPLAMIYVITQALASILNPLSTYVAMLGLNKVLFLMVLSAHVAMLLIFVMMILLGKLIEGYTRRSRGRDT